MTINEAVKVIEMCTDTVKRIGDDNRIYINRDYVISVLNMVNNIEKEPDNKENSDCMTLNEKTEFEIDHSDKELI